MQRRIHIHHPQLYKGSGTVNHLQGRVDHWDVYWINFSVIWAAVLVIVGTMY